MKALARMAEKRTHSGSAPEQATALNRPLTAMAAVRLQQPPKPQPPKPQPLPTSGIVRYVGPAGAANRPTVAASRPVGCMAPEAIAVPRPKASAAEEVTLPPLSKWQPQPPTVPPAAVPQLRGHCLLVSASRFEVVVGYHKELIEAFKGVEGRAYGLSTKRWNFPLSSHDILVKVVQPLQPSVFIEPLPAYVLRALADCSKPPLSTAACIEPDLSAIDAQLTSALMPFQLEGVRFGLQRHGRVLIADDMGLGKTIQAIGLAAYYRSEWPLLVVVPSSVRFAWKEQFLQWLPSLSPHDISVIATGRDDTSTSLVTIVSYDIMVKHKAAFLERRYRVVILDESHLLKSAKTARTKAALALCRVARRVALLSGTPALSRPMELYTQVTAVNQDMFGSSGGMHAFGLRYCEAKQLPWGWDYNGACNLSELEILLKASVMIRRTKAEVMSQLPAKTRQVITLDPHLVNANGDQMLQLGAKRLEQTIRKGSADQRSALLTYFHDTGAAKVRAVVEYVVDLLECDRKFLVFAHHQEVLDALENAVASQRCEYVRIDGRTPARDRAAACERFQSDSSVRVALLSILAANAGINLTSASLVIFAELFWNPGILAQAEDRAHRIGQKDCVSVQYLVAKRTADDYLWPIIVRKLRTLGEAGLSKDNFSEDTMHIKEHDQRAMVKLLEAELGDGGGSSDDCDGSSATAVGHVVGNKVSSSRQDSGLLKFFSATHPPQDVLDNIDVEDTSKESAYKKQKIV